MAFDGMPDVPSVSQRSLSITASQFSSFATPAITVPFPSVYAGQTQIPFAFTGTATWAATRVPTTYGGVAATAGVHSINSVASAAGYRTHDYGNQGGGGGGWPTWATAVIAACGGAAVVLIVAGLFCWRWRRKQKARKRAQAAALGQAAGTGRKGRRATKYEDALTEKPSGLAMGERRSKANRSGAAGAAAAGVAAAGAGARSRSRGPSSSPNRSRKSQRTGDNYDYPPPPFVDAPDSPSHVRSRDLAALGINRPMTASPSPHQQRGYEGVAPRDGPQYPQFAVPRERRAREVSASSDDGLLAGPAAPFAYQEGDSRTRDGYQTPPPRAPNTHWRGEYSPQEGSPAHLLTHPDGSRSLDPDTPRSSMTVSTRGTGGAPYRWDQDPDLSSHMPHADEVSAALGRAMLGGGAAAGAAYGARASHEPVGLAVGSPEDATWSNEAGPPRSTTPSYPPAASAGASSHSSSRREPLRPSALSAGSGGQTPRSTTPVGEPGAHPYNGGLPGGRGAPVGMGRSGVPSREGRHSRASTYDTAAEDHDDEYDDGRAPSRTYAR
ncbi:hypothetical protein Rhopal_003703-T1 [Rhodotorula paludigena]|uniref:Proteophosphoglycan ppg4 n=1 Tax=Rhodotorula paludigena TaxID=86838 RepID=A0AAV5GLB2_9BASI|nr:hypothetical protein Rhopal_003703-T1 [Rhodotorula paludigena]